MFPFPGCIEEGDTGGAGYRGKVAVTSSGRVCQRWDTQSPNVPDWDDKTADE